MRIAAIILPTYNESKTIRIVIEKIFEVAASINNWEIHVVVVDSDSPDNTATIVQVLQDEDKRKYQNLHIIKTKKEGLGKAYIEGFTMAIKEIKPFVLFQMDSDLSHDATKIPEFLEKIEKGADFVIGSRYIKGGSIPSDWGIHRKIFSICANIFMRFGFMKLRITDWTNGFRAIKVWIVQKSIHNIKDYTGYVFQVALLDNAIKMDAQITEIPINFIDRTEGESKINSFQYILHTFLYVFTHSAFIKFAIVGGIGFIVDFGISHILIDLVKSPIWLATVISAESAIVSNFLFNNYWSFSHKKNESNLIWGFLKFNGIALGSILIQVIGVQLCSNLWGIGLWPLYKVIIIFFIVIPYSYILYNKFVWKDK
ncbi:glycosyltransferase family 2 protein [soil metagenome]